MDLSETVPEEVGKYWSEAQQSNLGASRMLLIVILPSPLPDIRANKRDTIKVVRVATLLVRLFV